MATPIKPKRSITHEISVLKKNLELPITKIVFDKGYAFIYLFVNHDMIGTLGYDEGLLIHYHAIEERKIAWDKIYLQSKDLINDKILIQNDAAKEITIGPYKKLYVKDGNGDVIKMAYCTYRNEEWDVVLLDIENK